MDPFWRALSLFRRREYEECIEICNQLLISNPTLQGPWQLKMRAMTQRVYVDDIEAEEDAVTGSIDCPSAQFFSLLLPSSSLFFRHFFISPNVHGTKRRNDEKGERERNSDCIQSVRLLIFRHEVAKIKWN
jgi:hypothetical protein